MSTSTVVPSGVKAIRSARKAKPAPRVVSETTLLITTIQAIRSGIRGASSWQAIVRAWCPSVQGLDKVKRSAYPTLRRILSDLAEDSENADILGVMDAAENNGAGPDAEFNAIAASMRVGMSKAIKDYLQIPPTAGGTLDSRMASLAETAVKAGDVTRDAFLRLAETCYDAAASAKRAKDAVKATANAPTVRQ